MTLHVLTKINILWLVVRRVCDVCATTVCYCVWSACDQPPPFFVHSYSANNYRNPMNEFVTTVISLTLYGRQYNNKRPRANGTVEAHYASDQIICAIISFEGNQMPFILLCFVCTLILLPLQFRLL